MKKNQWLIYSLQTELSLEYDKSLGGNTSNLNVSKPYIEGNIVHCISYCLRKKIKTEDKQILRLNFLI